MRWLRLMIPGLLVLAGCQSNWNSTRQAESPSAPELRVVNGAQLRPGLTVNVQVLVTGEKEIDEKNRRISESGVITLPLVGEIRLADLTVSEAQALLKVAYSKVYVAPQVIVECLMETGETAVSPWGYVTVLGRVKKPGQVNMPATRELTVSRAIQLAGGLDTSARSNSIRVTRSRGADADQFEIDLDKIGKSGKTKDDIKLLPGDVVYVPEAVL